MIEAVFKYIYNYKKQIKDYIFVQLLVLLWICAYLKNGVYIEQFHILFVSRSIIFFFGILAIVVLVGYLLLLHKSRIRIREDMGEFIHLGMLPLSLILVFFSCGQNNVIVVIITMFLAVYAIILGLANIKKMTPIRKKNSPVPPKMSPNILKASRKERIAKGSGTSVTEVNALLKQFEESKKLMKMFSNGNLKLPF